MGVVSGTRAKTFAATLACAAFGLAGCAAPGEGGKGVPDAGGRTYGRLAITLTAAREGNVTIGTSARLLRYRGVDVDSAQVLAGTPAAERDLAAGLGRCAVLDDEALLDDALATAPPDASVQMLDAGELLVHVAGQTLKLAPRYVPDIVPFVSGVVYDAELAALEPVDWPAESRDGAFIAAFGGQQIGRFVAPAEVPAPPRITSASYERGGEVALSWANDDGATRGGPLQVVLSSDAPGGAAVRCVVEDTGRFVIGATLAARVAASAAPLTLSLERTRRTPFSAPGLDGAEVEITSRDVVTLK